MIVGMRAVSVLVEEVVWYDGVRNGNGWEKLGGREGYF